MLGPRMVLWETKIQRAFALAICNFVINTIDLYDAYSVFY